ncbi:unnamed protein product [Peniophora sp. CBMAI 1063]|nr:unnamed protein product [Peniophora sp. CBMAI 1063]
MPSIRFEDAWQISADNRYKCRLCPQEAPKWLTHSKACVHENSELHTLRVRELDRPPPTNVYPTRSSAGQPQSAFPKPASAATSSSSPTTSTSSSSIFPDFRVEPYVAIPGPRCASDRADQIYDDFDGEWWRRSARERLQTQGGVVDISENDKDEARNGDSDGNNTSNVLPDFNSRMAADEINGPRKPRSVGDIPDVPPISLPEFTIQAIDALHVGDKEAAKHCEVVQGHFAHSRIIAHRLLQQPAPEATTTDTAFWKIIGRELRENEEQWGPDRNSPGWRSWSRDRILGDMALWPAPLHLQSLLNATFTDLGAPPFAGGPAEQPELAMPPPVAAQGLMQVMGDDLGAQNGIGPVADAANEGDAA